MEVNLLIAITTKVREAIHKHFITQSITHNLIKNIHQNAIKYLTYLILIKGKLDNNQTLIPTHPPREKKVQHCILHHGLPQAIQD
jgi:hypothetical protein